MRSSISTKRRPRDEAKKRNIDPTGLMHFANVLREVLGLERLYHDGRAKEALQSERFITYSDSSLYGGRMISKKGSTS